MGNRAIVDHVDRGDRVDHGDHDEVVHDVVVRDEFGIRTEIRAC